MLTRRRFIAISAAVFAPSMAMPETPNLHVETGIALGATVTLRLYHSDAPRIAAMAMEEIRRLEAIFSFYLPDSALSRLNRDGFLAAPPFELLDCLTLAGAVCRASGGRFDPTIQPLWHAEARMLEIGRSLTHAQRTELMAHVGWDGVTLASDAITLRPGMALTLNGIAQGYIADRVAALLADNDLSRALIDTGEMIALPDGSWPVQLAGGGKLTLQNRALATSAPRGMTFGGDGVTSHIFDPATGRPVLSRWRSMTVSASSAAVADALSTAACLFDNKADAVALCEAYPGAVLESAVLL
ncbi:MAG: FAD:protein FMN transferase [Pseudotabrizicola sp.]|uniref:FAD:protein FMN transferase n=3 Tax=Pseudotabrizicola sp. TaxID=2939647 RepID=UPI002730CF55|nr:FAD:protein FMN transferase [Pseudotabrizicola sp.]MDP2080231.1 FAD:protein FMN transferase [Pseudotabrizicola sp.]MDZ7575316.1 FAD:protein FMN transferase [Pseudotabrizicola sp.]